MGIPDQFYKDIWRLPKKLFQRKVDLILNMGVTIKYNSRFGTDVTMEQLREENDAVFIGAGCLQTRPIDHRHRLVKIRGKLPAEKLREIDLALKIVFELN